MSAKVFALSAAVAVISATGAARAQDQAAIEGGEQIYEQHCQTCHGENLRSAGVVPDLRDLGADERPRFEGMVLKGRGQMPSWEGIVSAEEIDQLWAYIRSRAR